MVQFSVSIHAFIPSPITSLPLPQCPFPISDCSHEKSHLVHFNVNRTRPNYESHHRSLHLHQFHPSISDFTFKSTPNVHHRTQNKHFRSSIKTNIHHLMKMNLWESASNPPSRPKAKANTHRPKKMYPKDATSNPPSAPRFGFEMKTLRITVSDKFSDSLIECIVQQSTLNYNQAMELLLLGAIYISCPKASPPKGAKGKELNRRNAKDKPLTKRQRVFENLLNIPLKSVIEIHTNPQRFTQGMFALDSSAATSETCSHNDTSKRIHPRILFMDQNLIAVDKPCVIPSVPTMDNYQECVKSWLQDLLKKTETDPHRDPARKRKREQEHDDVVIFPVSRLDVSTSGVLLFARTSRAARYLSYLSVMSELYEKHYIALAAASIEMSPDRCGTKEAHDFTTLSHPVIVRHVTRGKSALDENTKYLPRLYRRYPFQDPAQLQELAKSGWITVESVVYGMKPCKIENDPEWVEVMVRLVTGKTHQLRLQMIALHSIVYNDSRYAPVQGYAYDDRVWDDPEDDDLDALGHEPCKVGLHAAKVVLKFPHVLPVVNNATSMYDIQLDQIHADFKTRYGASLCICSEQEPWWREKMKM